MFSRNQIVILRGNGPSSADLFLVVIIKQKNNFSVIFMDRETLVEKIDRLENLLAEKKKLLPRHSVRPDQFLEIEDLEERLAEMYANLGGRNDL